MARIYFLSIVIIVSLFTANAQKKYVQIGNASFYNDKFVGQYTASGEKYDHNKLTAAHLTLPFGTRAKVTNYENNKSVIVTINDRGPFIQDRIIDLSKSAAEKIDMLNKGLVKVRVEVISGSTGNDAVVEKPNPVKVKLDPAKKSSQKSSVQNNNEIYKIEAKRVPAGGFGVQVGSFKESFNFLGTVDEVKRKVSDPVYINVAKQNGMVYYKVIVGNVNNRKQAEELKQRLSNSFQGCFVVKLE